MKRQLLVDTILFESVQLTEAAESPEWYGSLPEEVRSNVAALSEGSGSPKGWYARGVFARADTPTANGRVYTGRLWEREIAKIVEQKVSKRACLGLLDHPKDGKTTLKDASHLITNLNFDGNTVTGESFILPTPNGQILKQLIESGVVVGISSRGVGTVQKGAGGRDIVQDDYSLLTFDFVSDPAAAGAYPEFRTEGVGAYPPTAMEEGMSTLTLEALKRDYPQVFAAAIAEAKAAPAGDSQAAVDALRGQMIEMVNSQRQEMLEMARSELQSDPQTGGARMAVEEMVKLLRPYLTDDHVQAMLAAKEDRVAELESKLAEAEASLSEMQNMLDETADEMVGISRRYFMAETLSLLEDSGMIGRIVSLVGDPARFAADDNDGFKAALGAAVVQVRDEGKRKSEEMTELERLRAENEELRAAKQKAIQIGAMGVARAYAEQRLSMHPQAPAIRELIEKSGASTTNQIDQIIEAYEARNPLSDDFRSVRESLGLGGDGEDGALAGGMSHLVEGLEDGDQVYRQISASAGGRIDPTDGGLFTEALMREVQMAAGMTPARRHKDEPY